ncbi:MAG: sodium/proline symporter [Gammaproteobacteria bacterium]
MSQTTVIAISLISYKVLLIGIGLWASRRVHDTTDFLLGGRNLGPWVAGLSYAASTSSAWVLLGFSGFVYAQGAVALWMLPGIWGGYAAVWLWFGPRLRAESRERGWLTSTDFMSANVSASSRRQIALLASVMILFCFVFYIAAQFAAAATAFTSNFDLSFQHAVLIGATIIVIYCLLGGFWAVSVTDMLQGVVMVAAAIIVPFAALRHAGGFDGIVQGLQEHGDMAALDLTGGMAPMVLIGFAVGIASIGLGTLGQPHLMARLMAVRGERERRQGFAIAITWAVVVFSGMAIMALAARAMSVDTSSGEDLFYLMASAYLPPVLAGIVIAAVLSAVMSTVDSLLIAASGAASHDLGLGKRLPGGELWVSRVVMVAIAVLAVVLTLTLPDSIFNRVLFAWSALGAAFGPTLCARVCGREPVGGARSLAIIVGFALTVLFYSYGAIGSSDGLGAINGALYTLAHLPGDPFERLFPWIPGLLLVFLAPDAEPVE